VHVFLLQYALPQEPSETRRECEAHSANVTGDGKRDSSRPRALRGKPWRSANDFCEEDGGADVSTRYVAENDAKNADNPDGGMYFSVGGFD